MSGPSAKIIADSINPEGHRITTFEVRFHRFVLAEFNTHRMFSRNSASSRAIPVHKQLAKVEADTAYPLEWPSEMRGMQGGDPLSTSDKLIAGDAWDKVRDAAIKSAQELIALGVHKSVVNRLLEPFMWHTAVVTATGFNNFFDQRCSPLAQPEIRAVAELMREEYWKSKPHRLTWGQWHLPYIQPDELLNIDSLSTPTIIDSPEGMDSKTFDLRYISAARCARTSYETQDGVRSLDADEGLFKKLTTASPPHWSPLEHVAKADILNRRKSDPAILPDYGNLVGWTSMRTVLEKLGRIQTYR